MNTIQRDCRRKEQLSDKRTLSGKRKQRLYDATVPNTEQTIRSVYGYETNCYYDTKELSMESVPDYDKQKAIYRLCRPNGTKNLYIHGYTHIRRNGKAIDFESEKLTKSDKSNMGMKLRKKRI
jgi:hypothetical protein